MTIPPVNEGATPVGDPGLLDSGPTPVALPHGSELTLTEASRHARELTTRVVVLAGPVESGKTTILTSLYESFRKGPVAGHRFAGSATLLAFERRCHPSRMESGRETAVTDRTRQVETRLLHLRLSPKGTPTLRNVLMTDISGETFRQASDFEEECRKLVVLKRADHISVVIDGAKVSSTITRDTAVTSAWSFLKRAIGASMIGQNTIVELIHSKLDLIQGTKDETSTLAYIDATEARFREEFGSQIGSFRALRIAARPTGEALPYAYGIPELLDTWVHQSLLYGELAVPPPIRTSSQLDRFIWPLEE